MASISTLKLLPHRYKKIGLLIALAGLTYLLLIIIFDKVFHVPFNKQTHAYLALIPQLAGLSMRSWSKEKQEDEMMKQIRLKSLATSSIGAASFGLIDSFYNVFNNEALFDFPIPLFVVLLLWMDQTAFWQMKNQYLNQNDLSNE